MNKMNIKTISAMVALLEMGGMTKLRGESNHRSIPVPRFFMQAAPVPVLITLKQPQPEVLVVNTPTTVKIQATIIGDIISGGANLIRLESNGQSTVLGQLSPDYSVGVNGYSIVRSFSEARIGTITLQISVALRGQLRRLTSQPLLLAVSTKPIPLPPDPGAGGNANLSGVDVDGDGIRDDVQRSITFSHPESETLRQALGDLARALQSSIITSSNPPSLVEAADCLYYVASLKNADATKLYTAIFDQQVNTGLRFRTFSGRTSNSFVLSSPDDISKTCQFDPNRMDN